MRPILLLIFSLITFFSCRESVDENLPEISPQPTLNSILLTDSLVKVQVSLAEKLDINPLSFIESALVLLLVDGELRDTLTYYKDGLYFSSTRAEPNKTYTCNVIVPGYPLVSGNDYIPPPETILHISHINEAGRDREGLTYPAIQFTFTNNPSEKLYYQAVIRLLKYNSEQTADLIVITDPLLLNEGMPLALFSNELITDDTYTMTLNYTTGSASLTSGGAMGTKLYPLIFELRTISRNYYQYVKQLYFYEQGRYPDQIGSSLSTASLYSNISEGYGIFAGFSSVQSDTIFPNHSEF